MDLLPQENNTSDQQKIEEIASNVGQMDLNSNEKIEIISNGNGEQKEESGEVSAENDKPKEDQEKPVRKYSYSNDQWSPQNIDGKKCYDISFLMQFRDDPNALKKPENIKMPELFADIPHKMQQGSDGSRSLPGMMKQNDLLPGFARGSRGPPPNRRSQQGMGRNNNNSSIGNNRGVIHVSLSLKSDVKLNETQNAWKPHRSVKTANSEEQHELDSQELYKKFRGVLNKMTPQNFDKLISQVRLMNIDSSERLSGVIDLVFEKALDEPNFSTTYALMCKELEQIKVKAPTTADSTEETYVVFRKLIVTKCQKEFEKADTISEQKQKEFDECTDPEKKKELQMNLAEEERKVRMRSVGNVRFIGELFKQSLITAKIMVYCITHLLSKVEEETLECLCKLLTTIGKNLEVVNNIDLRPYFTTMQNIVDNKDGKKVSSRVRFMLQDVIELRSKAWVPRSIVQSNPKTMDQIQNEMEMEQFSNYSSQSNTPRRDDRPNNMNKRGGSKSAIEDGWSHTPSRNPRVKPVPFSVDSGKLSRLSTATPITQVSLQPTHVSWNRGAATAKGPAMNSNNSPARKITTESFNAYNALRDVTGDEAPAQNGPGTYRSKGASIERSTFKNNFEQDYKGATLASSLEAFGDDIPRKVQAMMDQSQNDKAYGLLDKIQRNFSKNNVSIVIIVKEVTLWGLQFNKVTNMKTIGEVTGRLVDDQALTTEQFLDAFKQVMDTSIDLFLDGDETTWEMLASFVWAHMVKNALTLNQIHTAVAKLIDVGKGYEFLLAFFQLKAKEQEDKVNTLWVNGKMKLTDWFAESRVEEFMTNLPLDCFGHQLLTNPEAVFTQLLAQMKNNTPLKTVGTWIENKIGEAVKSGWFIRALTEAVYTYTLCPVEDVKPRFDENAQKRLNTYYPLLINTIGNKEVAFEVECLFAIQRLMIKLEHPLGLTVQLFDHLWDSAEVVTIEGFLKWETNADVAEQEGKGVMLMSLTSFYTALKSCDDSSDDTASIADDST